MALATSAGGSETVACRKRGSTNRPSVGVLTSTSAFTRTLSSALAVVMSSSPSIWKVMRSCRALRNCCGVGRSGLSENRDCPALATGWADEFQSTMSEAPNWSLMRSSTSPAAASGTWASWVLDSRVLVAMSAPMVSSVTRARLTPDESAPSTRTSNQLSIERDTNWYDTT